MNQILKPSINKKDLINCEFCNKPLYRKIIEWTLYGDERVINLDYERCNCIEAQEYWNEYDIKIARLIEEEKKLKIMQEFSRKVERIIKDSKMSKRNLNYKFENFEVNNNNRKTFQNLKDYTQKLMNEAEKKGVILVGTNGVRKNSFGL